MQVRAEIAGGDLSIRVEDDGQGAPSTAVEDAKGRGIDLLTRRLAALYGDAAALEYHAVEGSGFRVTLRVPAETIDSRDMSLDPGDKVIASGELAMDPRNNAHHQTRTTPL